MEQRGLFDRPPGPPFQAHSATSREAARRVGPDTNVLRATVLEFLRRRGDGGATDEEAQDALAMNPSTQRPRRVELVQVGLVWDSGRVRKTRSGRNATVWVASQE